MYLLVNTNCPPDTALSTNQQIQKKDPKALFQKEFLSFEGVSQGKIKIKEQKNEDQIYNSYVV